MGDCSIKIVADYHPETKQVVVNGVEDHCSSKSISIDDYESYFYEFYLKYFDTCPNFKSCFNRPLSSHLGKPSLTKKAEANPKQEPSRDEISEETAEAKAKAYFENHTWPVIENMCKFFQKNYEGTFEVGRVGSRTIIDTGDVEFSIDLGGIESESPDEIFEALLNDLYGEGLVPEDWEFMGIGEAEIPLEEIEEGSQVPVRFTINFKTPTE